MPIEDRRPRYPSSSFTTLIPRNGISILRFYFAGPRGAAPPIENRPIIDAPGIFYPALWEPDLSNPVGKIFLPQSFLPLLSSFSNYFATRLIFRGRDKR